MLILIQQLINGINIGCMYALLAIAYSLMIGVLGFLNFALHEVFMVCGYIVLLFSLFRVFPLWVSVAFALVGGAMLGILTDFICFRPINKKYLHAPLVSSLSFGLILVELISLYFGSDNHTFPRLIPVSNFRIGGLVLGAAESIAIIVAFFTMFVVDSIVFRTKIGRGMRALAVDNETAILMGVNTKQISFITFAITGILAAICAVLLAMKTTAVGPTVGLWFAIKGLAVMVVGGMGNIRGAMIAGLLFGLVEALTTQYLALMGINDAMPWLFLIGVLVLKRGGLFPEIKRTW